ncbi:hypothetical protein N8H22_10405 [Stutzerimonas stutzeri]|uniref:hypothetical protein n=1 Tax=Stutzerimonas sp. S1 TaxID=3030652 RepID=UPI002225912D|nr:hypothetical protein [Stutzerimonas sp. S1]MCW3149003.1 hypothetical protein [Stutzerimonas sp. S1]
MKLTTSLLCASLALGMTGGTTAAPDTGPYQRQPAHVHSRQRPQLQQRQPQRPPQHQPQRSSQQQRHWQQQPHRELRAGERRERQFQQRQYLPEDLGHVRRQVELHRAQIGRGGPVPGYVVVQKGKPLPHGWGRPLTARQRRGIPYYEGYEWRRLGRDLILLNIATGIVYIILEDVL